MSSTPRTVRAKITETAWWRWLRRNWLFIVLFAGISMMLLTIASSIGKTIATNNTQGAARDAAVTAKIAETEQLTD